MKADKVLNIDEKLKKYRNLPNFNIWKENPSSDSNFISSHLMCCDDCSGDDCENPCGSFNKYFNECDCCDACN